MTLGDHEAQIKYAVRRNASTSTSDVDIVAFCSSPERARQIITELGIEDNSWQPVLVVEVQGHLFRIGTAIGLYD